VFRVRDVMQRDVLCIGEKASIREAMETLVAHHNSGMPVVARRGQLVGIVSEFQLLEAVYLPEVKRRRVCDLMTKDVVTVSESMLLSDLTNMMLMHGIRRLPVVNEGNVVGILARRDVIRYLLDHEGVRDEFLAEVQAFGES